MQDVGRAQWIWVRYGWIRAGSIRTMGSWIRLVHGQMWVHGIGPIVLPYMPTLWRNQPTNWSLITHLAHGARSLATTVLANGPFLWDDFSLPGLNFPLEVESALGEEWFGEQWFRAIPKWFRAISKIASSICIWERQFFGEGVWTLIQSPKGGKAETSLWSHGSGESVLEQEGVYRVSTVQE